MTALSVIGIVVDEVATQTCFCHEIKDWEEVRSWTIECWNLAQSHTWYDEGSFLRTLRLDSVGLDDREDDWDLSAGGSSFLKWCRGLDTETCKTQIPRFSNCY